jgi:DNA-binding XRE family transcriptional regulator
MDRDTEDRFDPVPLVVAEAVARASSRPGFKEAWEARIGADAGLAGLAQARAQAGLTQAQVATRMGTSRSVVSRLEAALRERREGPTLGMLRRYAEACGLNLTLSVR